ncbi:hypothetical protein SAMN05444172_9075 [Burkholderia sp. GAS332]|nr:hypothetical protein SAMN05444172_9075 [Burkholderia sp. GAS332]
MTCRRIPNAIFALLLGGSVCIHSVNAQPVTTCQVNKASTGFIPSLPEKYVLPGSNIRVFYALTGEHAAVDKTDVNSNGVPDYIENVARQAEASRKAFNLNGFRDPLQSARYRGATFIDVNVGNIDHNGLAYSEPSSYSAVPQRDGACSIRIDISNKLDKFPGTYSMLAHEMFHLYQYGYTRFKPSWLIEPTANWAERVLRAGSLNPATPTIPLPSTMAEMQSAVFSQTHPYDFWSRLASLMTAGEDTLQLPTDLRYAVFTDGSPIFKGDQVRSFGFLSVIFQALGAESELVAYENGWPEYTWTAANMTSESHNRRILKVIQNTVKQTGVKGYEIDAFLAIE